MNRIIIASIIIFVVVIGAIGYPAYKKYSPLAELADCGEDCIDYKKVQIPEYATRVPDITIVEADADTLIMDIPIIIFNPSEKNTQTLKIDFDVYMEGKHLTKGIIPARDLPTKQNTTIIMEDVELKYTELAEVLQVVAARHGAEMVIEGEANISMTTDLVIYFPIEIFNINMYTYAIPITIETEIPVDMLTKKEYVNRGMENIIEPVPEITKTGLIPTPDTNELDFPLPSFP